LLCKTRVIIDNPPGESLLQWCVILCLYLRLGAGAELVSVLLFSGVPEELLTGALELLLSDDERLGAGELLLSGAL